MVVSSLYFSSGPVAATTGTLAPPAAPPLAPVSWQAAAAVGAAPTGSANQGSVSAVVTPWATAAGSLTAAPIASGSAPAAPASAGPNGAQPTGSSSITIFASPGFEAANSPTAPAARALSMGSFDTAHGVNVLFGGKGNTTWYSDTWAWNGTIWTQLSPASHPSARDGGAMAFDTATGATILFGGLSATTGAALNDTWSWNGTNWTNLSVTGPSARYDANLVYDAAIGKLVLFGGYDGTSTFSETWTFDGTTWTKLAPAAHPTARANPAISYDPGAQRVLLYGGDNGSGTSFYGDTWTFDGTTWTQQSPVHTPGQRSQAAMAFDPVLTKVILFGGRDSANVYDDVAMWTGADWQQGSVPLAPTPRTQPIFETGSAHGQLMLFGGYDANNNALGDTFVTDWLRLGEQRGFSLETYAFSDSEHAHVNTGNGNLVFHGGDLGIGGVGLNLAFDRHYNGQASGISSEVGFGWAFDSGRDVYLAPLPDGSQVLFGFEGAGGQLYFARNSDGSFKSPPGIDAKLSLTGSNYQLVLNSSSEKLTFGPGLLISDSDRNGNTISFTYNAAQQLTTATDTEGRALSFTYNGDGTLSQITDPTGRTWKYGYGSGFLQTFTDPTGAITTYSYDGTGRLARITDPVGNLSAVHYDGFGRVSAVVRNTTPTSGTGPQTNYAYSAGDTSTYWTKVTSTDPNGGVTTYQSDYIRMPLKVTDARGNSQSSSYTGDNNVLSLTDRTSAVYNLTWDNSNNLTAIQAASGPGATATYGNSAHPFQPDSATDAQGNCTSYSYDTVGNLTGVSAGQSTSPCGGLTGGVALSNAYQGDPGISCGAKPGELCSSTDGNGHATTYSYDGSGNLTKVTPPAPIGATTVVPDPLSRPSSVTDGKGQKTSYTYDKNGRITQLLFNGTTTCSTSAGTCIKYTYDGAGNLKTRIDVTGTSTFTYDFENRVTAKNTPAGNSSVTYDATGNVTKYTDASGSVSYTYDANNNVVDVVEPGGTKTNCGSSGTLCTLFGYDNGNRTKSVNYPNGVIVTVGYNTPGQETSVTAKLGSSVLVSQSYTYVNGTNNVGLRQTVADQAGNNTTYTYDLLNRLKTATTTGPAASSYSYGYDNSGNRTSVTANGVNTTYTYNAADEITNTGFTYDANGNLTAKPGQTYVYNSLNQTSSITTSGTALSMAYADVGQGERTTAGSTAFLTGLLGMTRQTGGSTLAFTRTPGGSLVSMRSGTSHFYYIFDALGSVIALTDGSGAIAASYTYDSYGTPLTTSGAQATVNPFRFASGYFDSATGLTKFGTRYYDSSLGRWTQRDPIGGSIANPGAMDRYVYAGDSPVNLTDVSGADWWNISVDWVHVFGCIGLAGGILAGAGLVATGFGGAVAGSTVAGAVISGSWAFVINTGLVLTAVSAVGGFAAGCVAPLL